MSMSTELGVGGDNLSTAAVVLLCNAELNIAEVAEIFM